MSRVESLVLVIETACAQGVGARPPGRAFPAALSMWGGGGAGGAETRSAFQLMNTEEQAGAQGMLAHLAPGEGGRPGSLQPGRQVALSPEPASQQGPLCSELCSAGCFSGRKHSDSPLTLHRRLVSARSATYW